MYVVVFCAHFASNDYVDCEQNYWLESVEWNYSLNDWIADCFEIFVSLERGYINVLFCFCSRSCCLFEHLGQLILCVNISIFRDISLTNLNGTIPSSIGSLTQLTYL